LPSRTLPGLEIARHRPAHENDVAHQTVFSHGCTLETTGLVMRLEAGSHLETPPPWARPQFVNSLAAGCSLAQEPGADMKPTFQRLEHQDTSFEYTRSSVKLKSASIQSDFTNRF
jgi:hypothetical protein